MNYYVSLRHELVGKCLDHQLTQKLYFGIILEKSNNVINQEQSDNNHLDQSLIQKNNSVIKKKSIKQ